MIKSLQQIFSSDDTDNTIFQFVRYTFVGGFAFVVDFSLLFVLTDFLGIFYLVSAAIAFIAGLGTNYLLSVKWVFSSRSLRNKYAEFLLFAGIGVLGLGFNELFLWLFTGILGLHYMISKVISTVFVYLWNFTARKVILFRKREG